MLQVGSGSNRVLPGPIDVMPQATVTGVKSVGLPLPPSTQRKMCHPAHVLTASIYYLSFYICGCQAGISSSYPRPVGTELRSYCRS